MNIKEKVVETARIKGFSMNRLEELCGFGAGTISKWDRSIPAADKLGKVADVLGVSTDYLLGRGEEDLPDSYDEIRAELDRLRTDPDLRVLLSASAGLTREDLEMVIAMAKRMKGEN